MLLFYPSPEKKSVTQTDISEYNIDIVEKLNSFKPGVPFMGHRQTE